MGGSNKGLKGIAILCALILGLALEHVQVEGKQGCCKSGEDKNCYNLCLITFLFDVNFCAYKCGCRVVSGCPSGYPVLHAHSDHSDTPNAVEFCNVGCRSSVCDSMNNEAKIGVELCGNACASFCNKIAVGASAAA